MKLTNLSFVVGILFSIMLLAMEGELENVTIVFLGKTGVGKSTTVNTFYNLALETAWDLYPKYLPIPNAYHACNVDLYHDHVNEDHSRGQLCSVTQKVAKYTAKGPGIVVNLIDCPGVADSRGVLKDFQNTENIAHFLAETSEINAICIVLKSSTNRKTVEELYAMDQIKTLIPRSMLKNRVFFILTHGTRVSENVKNFIASAGFPIDKIFAFDHFSLSKEGYVDPKVCIEIATELESKWQMSKENFSRLIEQVKNLGKCSTHQFITIHEIKRSSSEKINSAKKLDIDIKENQERLKNRKADLEKATNKYETAFTQAQIMANNFATAEREQQNANANVCFSELCYEANGIWFHEYFCRCPVKARQNRAQAEYENKKNNLANAWQKLEKKTEQKKRITIFVDDLTSDIDVLKKAWSILMEEIVETNVKLSKVSLGSISLHLEKYFNLCIKNISDSIEREKLEREREFYIEQIDLYQERLKNSS